LRLETLERLNEERHNSEDGWLDSWLDIDVVNWEKYDAVQKNRKGRLCKEGRQMEEESNGKEYIEGKEHDKPSSGSNARLETNG